MITKRAGLHQPCDYIVSSDIPNAPGQLRLKCSLCGGPVWISPSGQMRLAQQPPPKLACRRCLPNLMQPDDVLVAPDRETLRMDLRDDPLFERIDRWVEKVFTDAANDASEPVSSDRNKG